MITYKLHLIRTGSTTANPWKRYVGQSDLPVCDKGLEALQELHNEFKYPEAEKVFTSPLTRCKQTAAILYPEVAAQEMDGLKDMNLGEFEGKTFEELRGNEAFAKWLDNSFLNTPPGGEPAQDFTERALETLDAIFRQMTVEQVTNAAIVTHGGVIMTLLAAVGLPKLPLHQWAVGNGTGYTLLMNTQMWMRDRKAEVRGFIPEPAIEDDMNVYGLYFNE